MKPPHFNARWRLDHDPFDRPLGCNGRYGGSGRKVHQRVGTPTCEACKASNSHYQREFRRGQPNPRPVPQPCGTPAAAHRHRARGEKPCLDCYAAEAKYHADLRAAKKAPAPATPAPTAGRKQSGWTRVFVCGTTPAYARHRRRKEPIDDACRAAWNTYLAELKAKQSRSEWGGFCHGRDKMSYEIGDHVRVVADPMRGERFTGCIGRVSSNTLDGVVWIQIAFSYANFDVAWLRPIEARPTAITVGTGATNGDGVAPVPTEEKLYALQTLSGDAE